MSEILQNPIWAAIGVVTSTIIGIVAILVSIILFKSQRKPKVLSVKMKNNTQLLPPDVADEAELVIGGKTVKGHDLRSVVIAVSNNCNAPIESGDFECPIVFDFGKDAKVYNVQIINAEPKDLAPKIDSDDNRVVFHGLLLNNDESVTIRIIVSEFTSTLRVQGRIKGTKINVETPNSEGIDFLGKLKIGRVL